MSQLRLYFSPARQQENFSEPTSDEYNLFQWYIITRHSQQNSLIDPVFSARFITRKVLNVLRLHTRLMICNQGPNSTNTDRCCGDVDRTSSKREISAFLGLKPNKGLMFPKQPTLRKPVARTGKKTERESAQTDQDFNSTGSNDQGSTLINSV